MQSIRRGRLRGRAVEEALATYQQIWDQVEALERDRKEVLAEQAPTEIRYDRSVVEDFVAHLPEALRDEARLGREFLRETLKHVRVEAQEERPRLCPVCHQELGKLTPQHLARHGLSMREGYRRFPELGFTKRARLVIQPSPEGLLQTGEVFGLMVAGAGFEPATFGL